MRTLDPLGKLALYPHRRKILATRHSSKYSHAWGSRTVVAGNGMRACLVSSTPPMFMNSMLFLNRLMICLVEETSASLPLFLGSKFKIKAFIATSVAMPWIFCNLSEPHLPARLFLLYRQILSAGHLPVAELYRKCNCSRS
jgi:hypothetical protein